eukprot:scaffold19934_cov50-Attheya_sp.AAC.5
MDSIQVLNKETGKRDFIVSTHTMLINITPPDTDLKEGGSTRFYPHDKVAGKTGGLYDYAVDVWLPQGWGLMFPQAGMLRAGQPVLEGHGPKYVTQAGVPRTLPDGK